MIYDLYESGYGIRKIQYELEKRGRRTATGKTRWDVSNISRILRNSFYCGTIIYRKQFVPDYLEQKKINNFDMVEKVIVKGTHEPIISEEQYCKVQEILDSKVATKRAKQRRGKKPSLDVYCRKMKCQCHSSYDRKVWHRTKENQVQYAYQCYNQINTGTVATRKKKGLDTEGICETPMVPGWKIRMMADWIFRIISVDKENVIELASQMIVQHYKEDANDHQEEIKELQQEISRERNRLNNLVEMRMDGEIEKEVFLEKKMRIDEKIVNLENKLCEYELLEDTKCDNIEERLKSLQAIMKSEWNFSRQEIPEEVIDTFVDSIIVYQDHFEWNLKLTEEAIRCKVDGTKRKNEVLLVESPLFVGCSTGCD